MQKTRLMRAVRLNQNNELTLKRSIEVTGTAELAVFYLTFYCLICLVVLIILCILFTTVLCFIFQCCEPQPTDLIDSFDYCMYINYCWKKERKKERQHNSSQAVCVCVVHSNAAKKLQRSEISVNKTQENIWNKWINTFETCSYFKLKKQ